MWQQLGCCLKTRFVYVCLWNQCLSYEENGAGSSALFSSLLALLLNGCEIRVMNSFRSFIDLRQIYMLEALILSPGRTIWIMVSKNYFWWKIMNISKLKIKNKIPKYTQKWLLKDDKFIIIFWKDYTRLTFFWSMSRSFARKHTKCKWSSKKSCFSKKSA